MCFGDVHVAHLYISVLYLLVMSMLLIFINMEITKKHNTEIYKDEQHGHHQKT
jgi:hypothetical protein